MDSLADAATHQPTGTARARIIDEALDVANTRLAELWDTNLRLSENVTSLDQMAYAQASQIKQLQDIITALYGPGRGGNHQPYSVKENQVEQINTSIDADNPWNGSASAKDQPVLPALGLYDDNGNQVGSRSYFPAILSYSSNY